MGSLWGLLCVIGLSFMFSVLLGECHWGTERGMIDVREVTFCWVGVPSLPSVQGLSHLPAAPAHSWLSLLTLCSCHPPGHEKTGTKRWAHSGSGPNQHTSSAPAPFSLPPVSMVKPFPVSKTLDLIPSHFHRDFLSLTYHLPLTLFYKHVTCSSLTN